MSEAAQPKSKMTQDIHIKFESADRYIFSSKSPAGEAWIRLHFEVDPLTLDGDRSWVVAGCALSEGLLLG